MLLHVCCVLQLREEVRTAEADAQAELAAEEEDQEHLQDTSVLQTAAQKCTALLASIDGVHTDNVHQQRELAKSLYLLDSRQIKLLGELQLVYPIVLLESGDYSIHGAELPADCHSAAVQRDDEQIATALGYAVHLLLLISKYFDIPLRYQLIFCASRSLIADTNPPTPLTTAVAPVLMPLFKRGVERERFDCAVAWLKKDVQQILLTRGLEYEHKRELLYNLDKFFTCRLCQKLAC
jgi:hypothetical protein